MSTKMKLLFLIFFPVVVVGGLLLLNTHSLQTVQDSPDPYAEPADGKQVHCRAEKKR